MTKLFIYSGMSSGRRHKGPKRSTHRGKKEYNRKKSLIRMASKSKEKLDNLSDVRWETMHSESDRRESTSRGMRKKVDDIYSDPAHKGGGLVIIVSSKLFYDKEGQVMEVIDSSRRTRRSP